MEYSLEHGRWSTALSTGIASNSPLLLTNGQVTFAPDFTGLQTYSAATPSTWAPVAGGELVELPQIGLWIGEPGLGAANAIGQMANANQTLTSQTGVLSSHFTADGCFWSVTTVINPDEPEIAFRIERNSLHSADDSDSASYSADTPARRDLLLDSYSADTPRLPDQFVDRSQPTAAAYETTHTDVHAGYAPQAGGLPDVAAWVGGWSDDAATAVTAEAGAAHETLGDDGEATGPKVPEFGLFLAMAGDHGSLTVSHPPGAHGLTGSDTYLVSHRDADHAHEFNAAVTVNTGTVHDLGLNEIAVYAGGSVLDVVVRFAPADTAVEASANTAAVASAAATNWGRNLAGPHGPGAH